MSKTVTLNISDNAYKLLKKASADIGKTPEQVIESWVESKIVDIETDPLLQLAGAFESQYEDVAENHDAYVGKTIKTNGS